MFRANEIDGAEPKRMKLGDALREAARRIEAVEVDYYFLDIAQCNCGVLAQVIMDATDQQVRESWRNSPFFGVWAAVQHMDIGRCPVTDLPISSVVRHLREAGLTPLDLAQLEMLSNYEVCKRAGFVANERFDSPRHVVRYMRAWADILDEQHEARALDRILNDIEALEPCGV